MIEYFSSQYSVCNNIMRNFVSLGMCAQIAFLLFWYIVTHLCEYVLDVVVVASRLESTPILVLKKAKGN